MTRVCEQCKCEFVPTEDGRLTYGKEPESKQIWCNPCTEEFWRQCVAESNHDIEANRLLEEMCREQWLKDIRASKSDKAVS